MLRYFIQYLDVSVCLLSWELPVVVVKVIGSSKKKKHMELGVGKGYSSLIKVASCYY